MTGDVAIDIYLPDGRPAGSWDAFEYSESASFVAPVVGNYKVCVREVGRDQKSLGFKIAFDRPRLPEAADETRMQAERLSSELKQLSSQRTAAALHAIIDKGPAALALWAGRDVSAQVATLILIGDAWNALGDFPAAREQYRQAIRSNNNRPDELTAAALSNGATAELRSGDIEQARASFVSALSLWKALKRPLEAGAVLNGQGLLASMTGQYQEALDCYMAARTGLRATASEPIILNNVGLLYLSTGSYVQAQDYFGQALRLFPASSTVPRAKTLINLGRSKSLQGDAVHAIADLRLAERWIGDSPDQPARAGVLSNLGQALFRAGKFEESRERLTAALQIYGRIGDARGVGTCHHYLGADLAALGNPVQALDNLRQGLELRLSAGLQDDAIETYYEIARIQRTQGDTSAARQTLELALEMTGDVRVRIAAPDLRATYFASKRRICAELVDLLIDSGKSVQALEMSDSQRARSLIEGLGTRRYAVLRGLNPDLLDREQRLLRSLNFKSRQLGQMPLGEANSIAREKLLREVAELESQYYELDGEIFAKYPRRGALASVPPVSLAEVRSILDMDTVLLEFSLGDPASYAWLVTAAGISTYKLPPARQIEELARSVVALVDARNRRLADPALQSRFRASLRSLSRMLLAPMAGKAAGKRLAIVADRGLNQLPFAALEDPDRAGVPLGISREIVMLPSVAALGAIRRHEPLAPGPPQITVYADSVFGAGDSRVRSLGRSAGAKAADSTARLVFSAREAEDIGDLAAGWRVVRKIGFASTKSSLAEPEVRESSILHLATHTLVDDSRPELSGILFSGVDRNGSPRDGFLSLYDIYNLDLPMELVVLSACASAGGRVVGLDGTQGLTSAMLFAGASRVISTLWAADDESTALFMRAFYRRLFASESALPAAALRAARESLWRQSRYRDESYWSGFVLQGEWRPLPVRRVKP